MPKVLKAKLHAFLHDYRKRMFELEHDHGLVDVRAKKTEEFVTQVLDQKFHYHLHKKVDPKRAETIDLIHNYCREAVLPPVVSRLAERILLLQEKHNATLELVHRTLEDLADEVESEAVGSNSKS